MRLVVLKPECEAESVSRRLDDLLAKCLKKKESEVFWIRRASELEQSMLLPGQLQGKIVLFAVAIGSTGINLELYAMLQCIRRNPHGMEGSTAGLLIDGDSELDTKSIAREVVFSANMSGCLFIGQPLVEGTKSLQNFRITAANLHLDLPGAYLESARRMLQRLLAFQKPYKKNPRLLCLHASNYETSNTLSLWRMVRMHLENDCRIQEIALHNGKIYDCQGCPYQMCFHYGQRSECYYGGVIVEEVYPAVETCDALLLLCPNYNDALGANLTAFINRLTALFRKRQFYEKYLFSIIVSGYSGGDLVARQLISGLNMNKTFILPGNFALIETANDPGSILQVEQIVQKAARFAEHIREIFRQEKECTLRR